MQPRPPMAGSPVADSATCLDELVRPVSGHRVWVAANASTELLRLPPLYLPARCGGSDRSAWRCLIWAITEATYALRITYPSPTCNRGTGRSSRSRRETCRANRSGPTGPSGERPRVHAGNAKQGFQPGGRRVRPVDGAACGSAAAELATGAVGGVLGRLPGAERARRHLLVAARRERAGERVRSLAVRVGSA